MTVQRQSGESFDAYQERYHRQQQLMEELYTCCKVLDATISINRECWTEHDWYYQNVTVKQVLGRHVAELCRELAGMWGLLPAKAEEGASDDLPF